MNFFTFERQCVCKVCTGNVSISGDWDISLIFCPYTDTTDSQKMPNTCVMDSATVTNVYLTESKDLDAFSKTLDI